MSLLRTLLQAKEAVTQLVDGTAYRSPEVSEELSEEFRATIEDKVKPLLEPVEGFRQEKLASKTRRKTWFFRLGWLLWLPVLLLDLSQLISGDMSLLTLFVLGGFGVWIFYPQVQYIRHYKEKLIPVLIQAFGDYEYDESGCIDMEAVKSFDIMPSHSSKSSEDYIRGQVEGVEFEFCELKLERSGGNSSSTVHQGAVLVITMPFTFSGYTVVRADYGKIGNALASPLGRNRVALENPDFEDRYEVYGSDQQYARYLLSPTMMERIIALDDLFRTRAKGAGVTCEFRDNKALFMLSYFGDLMEAADIEVSAYDLQRMPLLEQELAMITGIIRQLKLDGLAARNVAAERFAEA
ncbi:DUF3137 domain-containing protein [Marinobacterium marinum]|uniref:DUF3137 domain-containing protein n=1 Tax=Marinobacterium marinum TaxID=2756129 RepID=A0A7W1WYE7_9GAMM|nr:DUF3137 domain-containing protein [Marinobacterium marinum]MBA4502517.1 DUF3137 domain-containing protein [Marinobacterium marinum]